MEVEEMIQSAFKRFRKRGEKSFHVQSAQRAFVIFFSASLVFFSENAALSESPWQGSPSSLEAQARSDQFRVRMYAALALSDLHDYPVNPLFRKLLLDENFQVRLAAGSSLLERQSRDLGTLKMLMDLFREGKPEFQKEISFLIYVLYPEMRPTLEGSVSRFYLNPRSSQADGPSWESEDFWVKAILSFAPVLKGEESDPHPIQILEEGDSRASNVYAGFKKLGPVLLVGGLVWSDQGPTSMSHFEAEKFCRRLGLGSRIPSKLEWNVFLRAIGSLSFEERKKYGLESEKFMQGQESKTFWVYELHWDDDYLSFSFYGHSYAAFADEATRGNDYYWVRCVS